MSYPKNLILVGAGELTRAGKVPKRAALCLSALAKIIYECVSLERTRIVCGPDVASITSASIIRGEITRFSMAETFPNSDLINIVIDHNILLGTDYCARGDEFDGEAYRNRLFLSQQIVAYVEKTCGEHKLDTVILVTHPFQALVTQERYAAVALEDGGQKTYGQVGPGEGIWMHKLIGTIMAVHLHDKIPALRKTGPDKRDEHRFC
ncbi:MAG: hypothetical protein HY226_00375 [Candidatus Vogelbacteria bacterium]|nr:hypothetical protein [Candidatus Vogelbacteria bacterium]